MAHQLSGGEPAGVVIAKSTFWNEPLNPTAESLPATRPRRGRWISNFFQLNQ